MFYEEEVLIKNFDMYNKACGQENLDVKIHQKIKNALDVRNNLPISLIGILSELITNEPQYYWNKEVMIEICQQLSNLYQKDDGKFLEAFTLSQEHFFAALDSYLSIIETYNELHDVSYDDELKTRLYRNTLYTRICEECLMNFIDVCEIFLMNFQRKATLT